MALRIYSGLIILLLLSSGLKADEIQIKPSHPDQYTVVEGDTLWGIADKFLYRAWQWPELWRNNSQISNPHLIYPGDIIYFSVVDGKPQLSLSREEQSVSTSFYSTDTCVLQEQTLKQQGRTEFKTSYDGKLLPCIRETTVKDAISLIPSDQIAKYLNSPRVVSENELGQAPYVIGFAGEHLIAGVNDKIYVRSIGANESGAFTIYRPGDTYISPENGQILGYEARFIGDSKVEQPGDPATLSIAKSTGEIRLGDRLMKNLEKDITLNYFPKPPEIKIYGSIISVLGGVTEIGQYNIVVIDKGSQDGIKIGHELDIYKKGRITNDPYVEKKNEVVKLPDELAGTLMVFRPFERLSYALVMKARLPIHILDKIQTP